MKVKLKAEKIIIISSIACVFEQSKDNKEIVTVEMIDDIIATEEIAKIKKLYGNQQRNECAIDIGDRHQHFTHPLWHDDCVEQRVTDGHITVIRHCRQNKKFINNEHDEKTHLCSTQIIRDFILIHNKIFQHFGAHSYWITQISKSQVPEKEVHGVCNLESTLVRMTMPKFPTTEVT